MLVWGEGRLQLIGRPSDGEVVRSTGGGCGALARAVLTNLCPAALLLCGELGLFTSRPGFCRVRVSRERFVIYLCSSFSCLFLAGGLKSRASRRFCIGWLFSESLCGYRFRYVAGGSRACRCFGTCFCSLERYDFVETLEKLKVFTVKNAFACEDRRVFRLRFLCL